MYKILIWTGLSIIQFQACFAIEPLSEESMRNVTGQALLYISSQNTNGYNFQKVGLNAILELNANIKNLKLGCGGVNESIVANACDIDIDSLALSGTPTNITGNDATTRNERAGSSASLENPFYEFAFEGNNASTRQLVGMRFSAEKVKGLLTLGNENTTTPNGLESISGYMKVQSNAAGIIEGYVKTSALDFDMVKYQLSGRLGALSLATVNFKTVSGTLALPEITNLYFSSSPVVINRNRAQSEVINAKVKFPNINIDPSYTTSYSNGEIYTAATNVTAQVTGCTSYVLFGLPCAVAWTGREFKNTKMRGLVSDINVNAQITMDLGMIHSLPLNTPAFLSVQKKDIIWPSAIANDPSVNTKKGWWLGFRDPVLLGYLNPTDALNIEGVFPDLRQALTNKMTATPIYTNDIGGVLSGNGLDVKLDTISLASSSLTLPLNNLQLTGQNFAPNCYGTAKFC